MFNKLNLKCRLVKLHIAAWYYNSSYKFRHWVFQWNVDEEADICFTVAGVFNFIKYKEHTIFKFGAMNYEKAPKYVE